MVVAELRELLGEDHIVGMRGIVEVHDAREIAARGMVAEHAHDRRDPAACGDEQRPQRDRVGKHEVTLRQAEGQVVAGHDVPHEMLRDASAGRGLHRDRDAFVVAPRSRGDGIRTGVVHAADGHAHPDVLPRAVPPPLAARTQGERPGARGLVPHAHDARLELVGGPQGVHQLEVVRRAERRGEHVGQAGDPRPHRAGCCAHGSSVHSMAVKWARARIGQNG